MIWIGFLWGGKDHHEQILFSGRQQKIYPFSSCVMDEIGGA